MRKRAFAVFLVMASAFPVISTDLYLPALPAITAYFNTAERLTNVTLICFSITLAVSMLIWGPLSDKYGRKPVTILAGIFYLSGSLMCAFSQSITQLICFRIIQAIGCGAAMMVATAFVKDVYEEERQEGILSLVQGMVLICPAIAPSIGALVLHLMNWQGTFFIQAIMGVIIFAGGLLIKETLKEPLQAGIAKTLGRLLVVCRNKRFVILLLIFSIPALPNMAFINASPYIFQSHFGLSSQIYALFFGTSAISMMAGTFCYLPASKRVGRSAIVYLCYSILPLSGVGILLFGSLSPFAMIAMILPSSFICLMVKPLGTFLMLNAQESDTGSVSSLIGFGGLLFNTVGMLLLPLFPNYFAAVGALYLVFGIFALVLFFAFVRKV